MATYVNDLRLTELATGEGSGTWGTTTNTNLELIGEALGYATQQAFGSDADATTTVADGVSDPARAMYYKVTSAGSLTATRTLTIAPNTLSRVMFIENATTGSQSIAISQGSGANVTIATGKTAVVYLDGAGSGAAVVDAMALVDPGVTDTLAEVLTAGNTTTTDQKIQFRDSAIYINSSADGQLDLVADTEIQIAATTVDINGNLDVSGTTVSAGKITADAGIDIDNINIDGTTIALSSGDLTLDVAGDIILDADGGDFKFRDGGAGFFTISNSSLDAVLKVEQSDEDFIIKGNDGGSEITAVTLDMSAAGAATFNSSVTIPTVAYVGTSIVHQGDTNTSLDFGTDTQTFFAGGTRTLDLASGSVVINEAGADLDFRVESVNSGYALFVDAGSNSVGIKTNATDAALNVNSQSGSIDAIRIVGSGGNNFIAGYGNQGNLSFTIIEGEADDAATLTLYRAGNAQHIIDADSNENVIFNEQGDNIDFRVESDSNASMLFVDASQNSVGIGTSSPSSTYALDVVGSIRTQGASPGLTIYETDASNQQWILGGYSGFLSARDVTGGTYPLQIGTGVPTNSILIQSGEVTVNETGGDQDFRVESDGNANMFRVDAGTNRVAVKLSTAEPENTLDVNGDISFTRTVSKKVSTGAANSNYFVIYEKDFATSAFTTNQHWVRIIGAGSTNGAHATAEFYVTFKQQTGAKYFNIVPIENTGLSIGYTYDASGGASSAGQLKIFAASTVGSYTYIQVFATARDGNSDDAINRGTFPMTDTGSETAPTGMTAMAFPLNYGANKYQLSGYASNSYVINEDSNDLDFRVESDNDTHALFVNGADGNVLFGTSTGANGVGIQTSGSTSDITVYGANTSYGGRVFFGDSSDRSSIQGGYDSGGGGYIKLFTDTAGGTSLERVYLDNEGGLSVTPTTNGHAVFNNNAVDADFRVASDNMTHALFVQGSDGKVGVFNSTPRSTLEVGTTNARHGLQLNGGPNGVATQIHMVDGKSGSYTTLTIDVQLGGAGGYMYQVQVAGTAGCHFQTGGGYTNGTGNFSHSVGTGSGFTVTSPSNDLIRLVATSGIGTHPVCEIKMTQALNANHDQDNVTITWSS